MAKRKVLILAIFLVTYTTSFGQTAHVQSMFIYDFTKLIDWPSDNKTGDFNIGVYGNSPITNKLNTLAATKKAVAQTINLVQPKIKNYEKNLH